MKKLIAFLCLFAGALPAQEGRWYWDIFYNGSIPGCVRWLPQDSAVSGYWYVCAPSDSHTSPNNSYWQLLSMDGMTVTERMHISYRVAGATSLYGAFYGDWMPLGPTPSTFNLGQLGNRWNSGYFNNIDILGTPTLGNVPAWQSALGLASIASEIAALQSQTQNLSAAGLPSINISSWQSTLGITALQSQTQNLSSTGYPSSSSLSTWQSTLGITALQNQAQNLASTGYPSLSSLSTWQSTLGIPSGSSITTLQNQTQNLGSTGLPTSGSLSAWQSTLGIPSASNLRGIPDSPFNHGANGGCGADDTAALNAAISADGYLYLPAGSCFYTTGITVTTNGLVIFGEGTLSLLNSSATGPLITVPSGVYYTIIKDITLSGYNGSTSTTRGLVEINGAAFTKLINVNVTWSHSDGIKVQSSSNYVVVAGCNLFYNTGYGIRLSSSYNVSLDSNMTTSNTAGPYIFDSTSTYQAGLNSAIPNSF